MQSLTKTGRYEILEELGRGAMGVVYRAHDPVIGRDVAVKTLHLSEDGSGVSRPDFIERFQTEAQAAGILAHPNIVVVYDAGEESGVFFITMELVQGQSLQSMLDLKQSFPLPRTLHIIEQTASALDYAHQRNIVHRDVKPANLMITDDDTVKITDFGTAKILRFNTTQTAQVIGTPSYMSPEQIKGKSVDGRSDIFSLGVILYEMVTGEKPFPGQDVTTVIYKIVSEEPISPRELAPSIHPGLAAVIMQALSKDPTERFQTCAELLRALKNHRNFPTERKEELHPAHMGAPNASPTGNGPVDKISIRPRVAVRKPTMTLPDVAPIIPPPAAVHGTVYDPKAQKSKGRGAASKSSSSATSVFWPSMLMIAVVAGCGYLVRPYTHDVWQVVQTWYAEKIQGKPAPVAAPASNATAIAPAAPEPDLSIPTLNGKKLPPAHASAGAKALPAEKVVNPAKPQEATADGIAATNGGTSAKQSPASTAAPVFTDPNASFVRSPQSAAPPAAAPSQSAPPTSTAPTPPVTVHQRLETIKGRLDQWLFDAGMTSRVQVSIVGNVILLQGKLRPAEHQALSKRLQAMPAWVQVNDDIAFENPR